MERSKIDQDRRRRPAELCLRRGVLLLAIGVVTWAALPIVASACEICWGARVDTPTTRGISAAMASLIGIIGLVGGGIGAFFYNIKRRSDLLAPGDLEVTESGDIHSREDDVSTF